MIQYIISGLVLGGVYAITALGVLVTYVSTGVMNFAYAGMAYFTARLYFFLVVQHGWSTWTAGIASLVVFAPLLGVFLWAVLFRQLSRRSPLIQTIATIGVSVALPPIAVLIFGNQAIVAPVGLAPQPVPVYHIAGVGITLDQVIVYCCVVAIVAAGGILLRFTTAGLLVRALVDSERLTSLMGTDPQRIAVVVWALTTFLAGLSGVLMAPIITLQSSAFTVLIAGAFAAVVIAQLKRLGVAVVVGLAMGVLTAIAQDLLPPNSAITADILPAVPFILVSVFLVWYGATAKGRQPRRYWRDRLDEISQRDPVRRPVFQRPPTGYRDLSALPKTLLTGGRNAAALYPGTIFALAACLIIPVVLSTFWQGMLAEGIGFGVAFLSYTLIAGEGGYLSLCQISFAGIGAVVMAQLSFNHHVPIILALLIGGAAAVVAGIVIGLFTLNLGDLYVALVTLTAGLLFDNIVFTLGWFSNNGAGTTIVPPAWLFSARNQVYFALAVFCIAGLVVVFYRRSPAGMSLAAARWSERGSRSIGLNVFTTRLWSLALGAAFAGIGGGLIAIPQGNANPASFDTVTGLVWVAVVVMNGIRSVPAALVAGVFYAVIPAVFQSYLPSSLAELPAALFGLGAVGAVSSPDGILALHKHQIGMGIRWIRRRLGAPAAATAAGAPATADVLGAAAVGAASTEAVPAFLTPDEPAPAADDLRAARQAESVQPAESAQPAQSAEIALAVEGVSVRFGGVQALSEVNLTVPDGGVVGLIGPNGAGKTTLFGAVSGLVRPTAGRVLLYGEDISGWSSRRRALAGIQRTFQQPELFPTLTVREHLALAQHLSRRAPAELVPVDELLNLFGIEGVAHEAAMSLPLGTTRALELARALAAGPRVLLMDEPTSGLNPQETQAVGRALVAARTRWHFAMVLVEHDVDFVLNLCDAVTVLDFGRVIASGPPEQIRADANVRSAYIGMLA
jgi:branched-chain amino acid transport system permease protein